MKTAVIGYSGAGKSTLSGRLAKTYHCPVLYLDRVQFMPGWAERDREEARRIVREFLDRESSWVMDGNYQGFWQERRLEEADQILFFNFSRARCFFQAMTRYFSNIGTVRECAADGCTEKMDLEFILWILYKGRTKAKRLHYQNIKNQYPGKFVAFHNHKEVERWFAGQGEKSHEN